MARYTVKAATDKTPQPQAVLVKLEQASALTEEALRETPPAVDTRADLKPIVDWNTCQPDGTPDAIACLLRILSQRFQATVFLGHLSRAGHAKHTYASDDAWNAIKRKPLWLRNALVEAAHSVQQIGSSLNAGSLTAVMVQAKRELGAGAVIGFGLTLDVGQPKFGCLIAVQNLPDESQADWLATYGGRATDELKPWLRCWHHNYVARNWLARILRVWALFPSSPRRILVCLFAVCMILAVPLPYWPKRPCVIEPKVRQFVSSPMDGRVLESLVKPGEQVSKGQVLARLDDEELRWALASAQAEYEATAKKRDIGLASKSSGNMRVAQLELEQISLRIESIKANLERLTVRSPIDGVVLQGEWYRSQGAPVTRGDTLFEVAPLDRMTIETHLSTEDLAQIHMGDEATLRVDSNQSQVWRHHLETIDPRAKVIDEKVVFVAEVDIEGETTDLRPGMKGTVTLSSGFRSTAWLLFHRPYRWLAKKLWW